MWGVVDHGSLITRLSNRLSVLKAKLMRVEKPLTFVDRKTFVDYD